MMEIKENSKKTTSITFDKKLKEPIRQYLFRKYEEYPNFSYWIETLIRRELKQEGFL